MFTIKLLCFLLIGVVALAAPLTQQAVDSFLQSSYLVPAGATIASFTQEQDKCIVVYKDNLSSYKFIIAQNEQGQPYVVFREQLSEINFGNLNVGAGNNGDIIQLMPLPSLSMPPMPVMPAMPYMPEMNIMPMPFEFPQARGMRHSNAMMRGFRNRGMGPCRVDDKDIEELLKQNLVIFRNGEIKQINKLGFERGSGLILEISLVNDNKNYNIKAGYMPRLRKLNVLSIEEAQDQANTLTPLEIGKNLVGKVVDTAKPMIEKPVAAVEQSKQKLESMIESFIEKLLVRKQFNLPTDEKPQPEPLLLGREGEPENKPFILGSEGEPELTKPVAPAEQKQVKPLLLGQEGEPGNVYAHEFKPVAEQVKDHVHSEEKSEEISELVTEVIGKLQLRKK